jgi:4-hydroxy-tetrahydrodipicolinate synthase
MSTQGKFVPVMITPFKENKEIDYKQLTALTEFYLKAGAKGLFANCLSSEMFELSESERLQITKHVADVAGGSVPVVSTGTFGGPIAAQADFVKKIAEAGADAVIAITSLLAEENESDETLDNRVGELIALTEGVPLGFYECPVPYKRVLSPEQLKKYVDTGRVVYHKDTSLDLDSVTRKIQLSAGSKLELYDAYMVNAVASQVAGAAGLSCIQGNFVPELVVWLCDRFADASQEKAVNIVQKFFVDNMDVMHDVYPIIAKYFLQKRGFDIGLTTRRDVGTFSPQIASNVDAFYDRYQALKSEIGLTDVQF